MSISEPLYDTEAHGPVTHRCADRDCPRPLHRCMNPACAHLVPLTSQYCCAACQQGHAHGYDVVPWAQGLDWLRCHSRTCRERQEQRTPAQAVIRPGA